MSWTGDFPNSSVKVDVDSLHQLRRLSTLINRDLTQPKTAAAEQLLSTVPYRNSYSTLFGVRNLEPDGHASHNRQYSTKLPPSASSTYSTGITVGYDGRLQHGSHLHRRTSLISEGRSRSTSEFTDSVLKSHGDCRRYPNRQVFLVSNGSSRAYPPLACDSILSDTAALCYCIGFIFPPAFLLGAISRPANGIQKDSGKLKSSKTGSVGFEKANAIQKVDWRQRCISASLISGMIVLSTFAIAVFQGLKHV